MPSGLTAMSTQCLSFRESFSLTNMKTVVRGFIYEYETPKIVTIHSISIALTCRLIQLLILIYGIAYLMVHKKGYQETNTSIISSITLKVKGIGYNQTGENQTLVIDGADYIVPPQENNALFLMTNFIRTDQEHKRCAETSEFKEAECKSDRHCQSYTDFQKGNGKWTGRCLRMNTSLVNTNQTDKGLCELEGWCPVENDRDIPSPIRDALNFTIFVKNFIEFPRFKVIRKNINQEAAYLKKCNYDRQNNRICPIFRVGTLLNLVEADPVEQLQMLTQGGVIRVKIDWKCNLDHSLDECLPDYSFKRLDAQFKERPFSPGFNFRFASHWKHQNQSYRTLTKAFGLRFIISVSGHAGRFDMITLSLNIGSLIGILGLATFVCDIVALYVHRQSDVYRKQKFQDVDLNLVRLETLNNLAEGMLNETTKRKQEALSEQTILTNHLTENHDGTSLVDTPIKEKYQRNNVNHHHNRLYDTVSSTSTTRSTHASSTTVPSSNYHQRHISVSNPLLEQSTPSPSSLKQRRSAATTRPSQLNCPFNMTNNVNDQTSIVFADEDSPVLDEKASFEDVKANSKMKTNTSMTDEYDHSHRSVPKLETFL